MNIIPKKIIFIYFVLFIINLILIFADKISKGYPKESWNITEWLINYQAGFVRRGLLGEVILNIYKYTGISPYAVIIYLCIIVYIIFILFYIRAFILKGYSVIILPFVYFLGGPIINDFLVRKDVLVVLIFILVIYFINNKKILNIVFSNMLLIAGLLIHETIGFFGFPIIILLLANNNIGRYERISNIQIKSVSVSITPGCQLPLLYLLWTIDNKKPAVLAGLCTSLDCAGLCNGATERI